VSALFHGDGRRLIARLGGETLWVEPWGRDSLRVRATRNARIDEDAVHGLLASSTEGASSASIEATQASITHGGLRAELSHHPMRMAVGEIQIRFAEAQGGRELLAEESPHFRWPNARYFESRGGDLWQIEARFRAYDDERIYGLGQHQHGRFNQKGCVVRLLQQNTEVTIPFCYSTRGYGFLWNTPATGRVELAANGTTWVADASPQLDYWVTAGATPREVVEHYTAVTGRAPLLPAWAAGFWQCRLRYDSQETLLRVAREHKRRGLPMDIIVIDFYHWTAMGEWRLDPAAWPDPEGMVRELTSLGIRVMVSVWPTVNANADTFDEMSRRGYLVESERGLITGMLGVDSRPRGRHHLYYYDATNPEARDYLWARVQKNYFDKGIRAFWLDADEPQMYPMHAANLRYHLGNGAAVTNAYPLLHQQGFFENMQRAGEPEVLLLSRSAWVGSQRYGTAVWSGDIPSTFDSFRRQIPAGLNMAMSGIPWWTTDIGGFFWGDISSEAFRELLVRWFQYGVFCPIFRLHGARVDSSKGVLALHEDWRTGADNEVWSYGDTVYQILTTYLAMRERLRPYVMRLMREAHETGAPPMRPLFFEFPRDPGAYGVEDQFLFGPDLLVAPVVEPGADRRAVYLPAGARWTDAWSGRLWEGGQSIVADAPLERIPVFLRDGATLPIRGA